MDVSAAVAAITGTIASIESIGLALFGVAAVVVGIRFIRRVMGA